MVLAITHHHVPATRETRFVSDLVCPSLFLVSFQCDLTFAPASQCVIANTLESGSVYVPSETGYKTR